MKDYLIRIHSIRWHTCFVKDIKVVHLYSFISKVTLFDRSDFINST